MTSDSVEDLRSDARRVGLDIEYVDGRGQHRATSAGSLGKIIEGLAGAGAAADDAVAHPTVQPAFAPAFGRIWVLAVQLYGVRSAGNWGHGDFGDLHGLIEAAAKAGAAGVGLNPLHVLFEDRTNFSPYSPNSRLFLNPLYIDVERIPGLPNWRPVNRDAATPLRDAEFVDYPAVAQAKRVALRDAFARFRRAATAEARRAFDVFKQQRGPALRRFACFEVLRRRYPYAWWDWPQDLRKPDDAGVVTLMAKSSTDVAFHEFVQWVADEQLSRCQARAKELGMPIGLYLDVAVGVASDGFDAWNEQGAIMHSLSIGAPPDALNGDGQNWGLAGFNPQGLAKRRFAPLREMLHASMRYAGAIRLDHILGLKRLYVVPFGFSAADGAYLNMPFESLLSEVAAQSFEDCCVVIGEDLGTVPEGFRDAMARWGLWGYRVMIFERMHDGAFTPPDAYSPNALVTFSTHDLPTFAGWMRGRDIALKQSLGMDPGETADERRAAVLHLRRATQDRGIEGDDFVSVARFLAETPSRLEVIAMEDVLDVVEQPNLPGTMSQHPNWLRKLPVDLESLGDHEGLARLAGAMRLAGRAAPAR